MKIKNILLIVSIAMTSYSCKNSNTHSNEIDYNTEKQVEKKVFNKSFLTGVWAENKDDNALFYIENDSIYFVEHQDTPFLVDLINNEFVIYFDKYTSKNEILKLTNDSLIYKSDSDIIKFYKRK